MKKWLLLGMCLVLLVAAAVALSPYLLPTRVALGPCGRDWTSPTSYLPRISPTRSERWSLGGATAKVCYGSPSVREREIFGGLVPWGELWRTGANEPTRIFVDAPILFAGVLLEPGRYSVYTLPGPQQWQIFVSRSTFHWGNAITPAVRAQEVGSATVPVQPTQRHVEQMTFNWEPDDGQHGKLVFEWDATRVEIPVAAGGRAGL